MIRQEKEEAARVIIENDHFIALAPMRRVFLLKSGSCRSCMAPRLKIIRARCILARAADERCFDADRDGSRQPAYNLMIHTSPIGEETNPHYHWHIEIMPKLTKVAGFEWGSGFYICPTPPEESAKFLREAQVTIP